VHRSLQTSLSSKTHPHRYREVVLGCQEAARNVVLAEEIRQRVVEEERFGGVPVAEIGLEKAMRGFDRVPAALVWQKTRG